jgi:hypothetical protein
MCDPVSLAILATGVISGAVTKHQGDKSREQARDQAEEAKRRRLAEKARFDKEQKAGAATPTLLKNAAQSAGSVGMQGLTVGKGKTKGSTGLNTLGTGGTPSTGLNIPKA